MLSLAQPAHAAMRSMQRATTSLALRTRWTPAAMMPSVTAAAPAAAASAFHSAAARSHNHTDWPVRSAQYFRDLAAKEQAEAKAAAEETKANQPPAVRVDHVHPTALAAAAAQADAGTLPQELSSFEEPAAEGADASAAPASLQFLLEPASHFAVVRHRGAQFKVVEDDLVMLDRISGANSEVGSKLLLDEILMLGGRDATVLGRPTVQGALVYATIEEHTHTAKVVVFKKKRRKGYKRKQGHRDMVTVVRINKILLPVGTAPLTIGSKVEYAPAEAVAASAAPVAAAAAAATPAVVSASVVRKQQDSAEFAAKMWPAQKTVQKTAEEKQAAGLARFKAWKASAKAKREAAKAAKIASGAPAAPAPIQRTPEERAARAAEKAALVAEFIRVRQSKVKSPVAAQFPAPRPYGRAPPAPSASTSKPIGARTFSTLARRRSLFSFLPTTAAFSTAAAPSTASASASAAVPPPTMTTNETAIKKLLTTELKATALHIEDTSGGCGAFFRVLVVSPAFTGLSLVKQHRLVNQTLKPHIANLHGLTLTTFTEEQWQAEQKRSS